MGLLLDYTTGVGMPRPTRQHQRVMMRMQGNLFQELIPQGFEPLSETTVTDDLNDLVPDLIIFDEDDLPGFIMEITTHRDCRKIMKKCYELMERFPRAEYFIYDYEQGVLYMYDAATDSWPSSEEYEIHSRFLQHPLLNYLA